MIEEKLITIPEKHPTERCVKFLFLQIWLYSKMLKIVTLLISAYVY